MSKLIPMIAANRDQLSQIHADKNRWNKFLDNMAAKIRGKNATRPTKAQLAANAARRIQERDDALYSKWAGEADQSSAQIPSPEGGQSAHDTLYRKWTGK